MPITTLLSAAAEDVARRILPPMPEFMAPNAAAKASHVDVKYVHGPDFSAPLGDYRRGRLLVNDQASSKPGQEAASAFSVYSLARRDNVQYYTANTMGVKFNPGKYQTIQGGLFGFKRPTVASLDLVDLPSKPLFEVIDGNHKGIRTSTKTLADFPEESDEFLSAERMALTDQIKAIDSETQSAISSLKDQIAIHNGNQDDLLFIRNHGSSGSSSSSRPSSALSDIAEESETGSVRSSKTATDSIGTSSSQTAASTSSEDSVRIQDKSLLMDF